MGTILIHNLKKIRVTNSFKGKLNKEFILYSARLYYQKEVSSLLKMNSPMLLRLTKRREKKD